MVVHFRLKKKPWLVKYREPWTGKQRQKAFLTEEEARAFDAAQSTVFEREKSIIKAVKRKRRRAATSSATLDEICQRYLDTLSNPTTRAACSNHLKQLLDIYGHRKAHCLTIEDMHAFLKVQATRGVGKSTAQRRVRLCKTALTWAVKWGLLPANPLATLELAYVPTRVPDPPTVKELQLVYPVAAAHVQRVIVLGMATGARIGPSELFRLRWSDVDLSEATMRMTNADKGGSRYEAREVPIREDILPLLREWEQADAAISCPWVIHHKGKPVSCIGKAWHAALKRAGIERRIRPYDLRHAFATRSMEHGADLKSIAEIMGHADEKMLLKVYQHSSAESRRRAVNTAPPLRFES